MSTTLYHTCDPGKDCGKNTVARYSFEEKLKMALFPNSQSPKVDNELLSTRRLLMLYQYFAQTKDTNLSTISFVQIPSC